MPVPGASANYLRGTQNTAFSKQTQGGTLLGNDKVSSPASPVSNLFPLIDNAAPQMLAGPVTGDATNPWGQKVISGSTGDFAYQAVGEYQIMTISTKIAGDDSTEMLIPGAEKQLGRNAIHQFQHDFGVDTTSLMRAGRYASLGYETDGTTKLKKRSANLWLNAAGNAYAVPSTLTGNLPWAPGGSARNGTGAFAANTDSAANPTRAIPGRLVMKANFVDGELDPWTASVVGGSDFYTYKAITGM
jgi:hypothetical protein